MLHFKSLVFGRRTHVRSVIAGFEQQNGVWIRHGTDKVVVMRTAQNLAKKSTLFALTKYAINHQRYVLRDGVVQRKLWLFEKQEAIAFLKRPEKTDEPESSVGKLIFSLP